MLQAFDKNLGYFEKQLLNHPLLKDKKSTISELVIVYKEKKHNSCISMVFPLIDFIIRKFLHTANLNNSVTKICKLFKECGFDFTSINQLMPNVAFTEYIESKAPMKLFQILETQEYKDFSKRIEQFNFGIIGGRLIHFYGFQIITIHITPRM